MHDYVFLKLYLHSSNAYSVSAIKKQEMGHQGEEDSFLESKTNSMKKQRRKVAVWQYGNVNPTRRSRF